MNYGASIPAPTIQHSDNEKILSFIHIQQGNNGATYTNNVKILFTQ